METFRVLEFKDVQEQSRTKQEENSKARTRTVKDKARTRTVKDEAGGVIWKLSS